MPIERFDVALSQASRKPKGVRVTQKLWDALKAAKLITMGEVAASPWLDPGFKLPFYKGVVLVLDPELGHDGQDFLLTAHAPGDTAAGLAADPVKVEVHSAGKLPARPAPLPQKWGNLRNRRWLGRS